MKNILFAALASAALLPAPAWAQQDQHLAHPAMQGMGHDEAGMDGEAEPSTPLTSQGSGTAGQPGLEGQMHGLHIMSGAWMIMVHGNATLHYTDHSGLRGDDKTYATSMAMIEGRRDTAWGSVQLRTMMSLEPLMNARGYPNLFATGETADGLPLVDRQHPDDLFMELAGRTDIDLGKGASLFLYGGPVAEPALGPSAFMHRASAKYNPEPPITHHWFDSTHITYGVVTVGLATRHWQLEGSAFRGAEPDEKRWGIESPKLDSWSVRATWAPSASWAVQASYGEIHQPESTHPGEDEHRLTSSVHFNNGRRLAAMVGFSAKDRVPGPRLTAWIAEVNWDIDDANTLFSRVENVANDELFPDHADPLHDVAFRVTKGQAGYARRVSLSPFELAIGGSLNLYGKPRALNAAYGRNPWGYTIFARISLGS